MTVAGTWAIVAPNVLAPIIEGWSLRWYAIVVALLIPVVVLRIADRRLRAAG